MIWRWLFGAVMGAMLLWWVPLGLAVLSTNLGYVQLTKALMKGDSQVPLDRAYAHFERANKRAPGGLPVLSGLARVQLHRGEAEAARASLAALSTQQPGSAHAAVQSAWIVQAAERLSRQGRNAEAEAVVALLEDTLGMPQSDMVQGDLYAAAGRSAEARDAYLRAISHDPSGSLGGTVYLRLGKLYVQLEQWQQAITYLQKAAVDPGQRVMAYGHMNGPLVRLGRRQEAIENNQRLLAEATWRHWKNVFSMNLGYLYGRRDCTPCDFEEAYFYFRQAREWAVSSEQRVEAEQWMQRAANQQDH